MAKKYPYARGKTKSKYVYTSVAGANKPTGLFKKGYEAFQTQGKALEEASVVPLVYAAFPSKNQILLHVMKKEDDKLYLTDVYLLVRRAPLHSVRKQLVSNELLERVARNLDVDDDAMQAVGGRFTSFAKLMQGPYERPVITKEPCGVKTETFSTNQPVNMADMKEAWCKFAKGGLWDSLKEKVKCLMHQNGHVEHVERLASAHAICGASEKNDRMQCCVGGRLFIGAREAAEPMQKAYDSAARDLLNDCICGALMGSDALDMVGVKLPSFGLSKKTRGKIETTAFDASGRAQKAAVGGASGLKRGLKSLYRGFNSAKSGASKRLSSLTVRRKNREETVRATASGAGQILPSNVRSGATPDDGRTWIKRKKDAISKEVEGIRDTARALRDVPRTTYELSDEVGVLKKRVDGLDAELTELRSEVGGTSNKAEKTRQQADTNATKISLMKDYAKADDIQGLRDEVNTNIELERQMLEVRITNLESRIDDMYKEIVGMGGTPDLPPLAPPPDFPSEEQ